MDGAWIYIVRCNDGSYYTGLTRRSLDERVAEHNSGLIEGYTKNRLPVTLVYSEHFQCLVDAIEAERKLKGWSRAKKDALIAGRYDLLPGLSRRGGGRAER